MIDAQEQRHEHERERVRPLPPLGRRLALVLGLFVLAPLTAEYLLGYDSSVGRPLVLLGGLLILGPLYGAPALLIRAAARGIGAGWPTILLFAAAFGIVEAGLVDQSMFSRDYRDIQYWTQLVEPTYLPPLGFGAYPVLTFVLGHVIWSIAAPIAITESFAGPHAHGPWFGRRAALVLVVLYVLASWLVFQDHLRTEGLAADPGQLVGAALAALLLVLAGLAAPGREGRGAPRRATRLRSRPATPRRDDAGALSARRTAPASWATGLGGLLLLGTLTIAPTDWIGLGLAVTAVAVLAALIVTWSGRAGWGPEHVLALAASALAARAVTAFLVPPIDDPPIALKLAHNVAFALGVLAVFVLARRQLHKAPRTLVEAVGPNDGQG